MRCENPIDEIHSNKCWNMATKLAILKPQYPSSSHHMHQRIWICDDCFELRLLNDRKFTEQLLQVTNLSKNKNDID